MDELKDIFGDIELEDFDLKDIDLGNVFMDDEDEKCRIHKPKLEVKRNPKTILYKNAEKLVSEINFKENDRFFIVVDGSFIFGDFIESFIVKNNIYCKNLTISTLSYSEANIYSLENLLKGGFLENLNLIVSDYFYSHERRNLISLTYEKLDIDNKFQLAVSGTHCKLALIETLGGKKITIHGSANLRSSNSLEHFTIEDNAELYDFNMNIQGKILDAYKTINKALRGNKLRNIIRDEKNKNKK